MPCWSGIAAKSPASPLDAMDRMHRLYQINTAVWLRELSQRHDREITLATVPETEIAALADWGYDSLWLMGIWRRGEATRRSALNYIDEYRHALPDIEAADVIGSAYAIHAYEVEADYGGREGLAQFRQRLRDCGIKLILDFVPNHVAADHAWIRRHPEFFIGGTMREAEARPGDFFTAATEAGAGTVIAHGRDPYFPAWIDTAQLNAFSPGLRRAWINTLIDIGGQCDGLRCDMAMLLMNDIFAETWGERAGPPPEVEFWREVIGSVREAHPQLQFIAEVYWERERELQAQGFDYTYDKGFYDQALAGNSGAIKRQLEAGESSLRRSLRFIENHDEARAATAFGADRGRAAAVLLCALPGAALLHEGQLTGRRIKLPVQISRRRDEPVDWLLERFYRRLLHETRRSVYREGPWRMLSLESASEESDAAQNLIVCCWQNGDEKRLVAVNLAGEWARCVLDLTALGYAGGERLRLFEVLSRTERVADLGEWRGGGLIMEIPPSCGQIYHLAEA